MEATYNDILTYCYEVTKIKLSPTLLLLVPLRPAVSRMAGNEIDPLMTMRRVRMDISEDYND